MEKLLVLIQENLNYLDVRMTAAINFKIFMAILTGCAGVWMLAACYAVSKKLSSLDRAVQESEAMPAVVLAIAGGACLLFSLIDLGQIVQMMGMGKFYYLLK